MRVAIADDSVLLREGLARLLAEAGFEVVAQAGDAEGFADLIEATGPDVAILDIRMPPTHTDEGLRAAIALRGRFPGLGVLLLSQYVRPSYVFELLADDATGVGYLLKDRVADVGELGDAVRRVAAGGSVLDPTVVAQLVGRRRDETSALDDLSEREREVLALMAEGRSNRSIAERLVVTERTVEKHTSSIFQKLRLPATDDTHRRVLAVLAYLDS
ncbi:MAG: response regulator transcription factor [Thermoleophilia bacterium]